VAPHSEPHRNKTFMHLQRLQDDTSTIHTLWKAKCH